MSKNKVQSDQLYDWSDNHATNNHQNSPPKTKNTPSQASPFAGHAAWLTDRTVQALRQARMQMRERTRSWPQVLPIHQPVREEARNGLRPRGVPRTGKNLFAELSPRQRNPGRTLLHLPRAFAPQGTFLDGCFTNRRNRHEYFDSPPCRGNCSGLRQHVGTGDAIGSWFMEGGTA